MERYVGRHLRGATLPLLISLVTLVVSGISNAEPTAESLVILPVQFLDGGDASEIDYAEAIEGEIKKRGQFVILRKSDAFDALQPSLPVHIGTPLDRLLAANRNLDKAEEKVFTEPGAAVQDIEAAIQDVVELAGLLDTNSGYDASLFRGYMLRARALMDSGESERAKSALADVVRIFGDEAEVTRQSFHPTIVSLYEEALRDSGKMDAGNIDLASTSKGAQIYLSGRLLKLKTDAVISGVLPGEFTVRTVSAAGRSKAHAVRVDPGETVQIRIDHAFEASVHLEAGSFALKASEGTPVEELEGPALRVGSEIGADKVLLTGVRSGQEQNELFAALLDVRGQQVVSSASAEVKTGVVSYGRVSEVVDGLGIQIADSEGDSSGGWTSNIGGWALTGAGVVGLGVGAAMGAQYASKSDELAQSQPLSASNPSGISLAEAQALQRDAESAGTVAAIAIGAGAAALVGGVVLFITHTDEDTASADNPAPFWIAPLLPTQEVDDRSGLVFGFQY